MCGYVHVNIRDPQRPNKHWSRNWSSWLLWAAWWEETSGLIFLLFCSAFPAVMDCASDWVRVNLLPLVALVRMLYHGDQNNHQYTYKAPPHIYLSYILHSVPSISQPSFELAILSTRPPECCDFRYGPLQQHPPSHLWSKKDNSKLVWGCDEMLWRGQNGEEDTLLNLKQHS